MDETQIQTEAKPKTTRFPKVFNDYLGSLRASVEPKAPRKGKAEVVEAAKKALEAGYVERSVASFEPGPDGKKIRAGNVIKQMPLRPTERAKLLSLVEAPEAVALSKAPVGEALRAAFIEGLAGYCNRARISVKILRDLGVPESDLKDAGLI